MNNYIIFFNTHLVFVLSLLTAVIWYYYSRTETRSLFGFVLYPIYHFREILDPRENSFVFVIVFSYLTFLSGIAHFIFPESPYAYLFWLGGFLFFEYCMILIYILQPRKLLSRLLIFIIPGILIAVGIYLSVHQRSYQPMNIVDFMAQVTLFIGAVTAILEIINKDLFPEKTETFFIAFGLIIFSFLHILSTSIMILDFVEYFDFSYYATLITLLYWIVIIPWIKRLKSKLSS